MNNKVNMKTSKTGWLALATSMSTLLCCTLPVLLVALGFGAVVAALTMRFPALITLSEHGTWLFAAAGILLAITAWFNYRQKQPCPSDPEQAALCQRITLWNWRVFWAAACLWLLGFLSRYVLLPVTQWLGF